MLSAAFLSAPRAHTPLSSLTPREKLRVNSRGSRSFQDAAEERGSFRGIDRFGRVQDENGGGAFTYRSRQGKVVKMFSNSQKVSMRYRYLTHPFLRYISHPSEPRS